MCAVWDGGDSLAPVETPSSLVRCPPKERPTAGSSRQLECRDGERLAGSSVLQWRWLDTCPGSQFRVTERTGLCVDIRGPDGEAPALDFPDEPGRAGMTDRKGVGGAVEACPRDHPSRAPPAARRTRSATLPPATNLPAVAPPRTAATGRHPSSSHQGMAVSFVTADDQVRLTSGPLHAGRAVDRCSKRPVWDFRHRPLRVAVLMNS